MLTSEPLTPDVALPALDLRALARRAALPVLAAVALAVTVWLAGGLAHPLGEAVRRLARVSPEWLVLGAGLEAASLAGYVALLALVAGRFTPRVGLRESTQITLAGAAATRLLPTAGAGGAALTVWTLRRAGLRPVDAGRTLLVFFVLLYSVFLGGVLAAGIALALGGTGSGPGALGAVPAAAAAAAIAASLLAARRWARADGGRPSGTASSRLLGAVDLVGSAVRDAAGLVRSGDLRLVGALAYWALDAGVLWTMLHAFGTPPSLAVVALAYLLGQVANTLPLPGSVSGGMAGVLIAFHVPAGLALSAVLAYRTIAVWLPTPAGAVAVPRLRATVARWASEPVPAGLGA